MHLTVVTSAFNVALLTMELLMPGILFLSGCVTVWGKFIRKVNRLVVNHVHSFWAMLPLPDRYTASLGSWLLGDCWRTDVGISYTKCLHTS